MPRRFRNTRRENRLEELGRVDAERAHTSKGKRNLREEKDRIRSELATGGSAATKPPVQKRIDPKTKRPKAGPSGGIGKLKQTERNPQSPSRPKAGPSSAPRPRKKVKTYGGGPDSGNIGKMKDAISKFKDKGLGKAPKSSLDDIRKKFKRKMPKYMQPLRKGGSAKYAAGNIVKGAIKGAKKMGQGLGSTAKKIGKGLGSAAKKIARKKYASGGAVMAGKKVGCQIK